MRSSVKQTKIPFTERKLRTRTKSITPKKIDSSEDENSPLKYELVVSSENKIILKRSSTSSSEKTIPKTPELSTRKTGRLRSASKREVTKSESVNDEDYPTPSKRKCCDEVTPVQRMTTPSALLSRLELNSSKKSNKTDCESPLSDGKRKALKPKELFPSTNASSARKALFSSSDSLPCREAEINQLCSLLEKHMEEQSCGSIYISGLPGTGKTASIDHVIHSEKIIKGYHIVKINCTCVSSSVSIYKRICTELRIKTAGKTEKDPKVIIEKYLLRRHKMILLILDEIDQLETRTHSVLYQIFEWPSWEKARLVLIGIANAMDLTDRILPRLCAKVGLKPVLIHFTPYSKDQIKKILSHRLSEVGADSIFTPSAIELISAKVAGMSGDVRRALDLGRRVVEVSEESKAVENSSDKKIDQNGIDTNLLAEFIKKNDCRRSPRKAEAKGAASDSNKISDNTPVKQAKVAFFSPSKTPQTRKTFDDDPGDEGVLKEINLNRENKSTPRKGLFLSPTKSDLTRRESPRKRMHRTPDFSVDSKDVLNVVKNIYGSSKTLKSNGESSSFPLHQKLLICTFLLISKKGKTKDLNVGKLHQVYTKICTKRGITPVDLSGFLFLSRQVEMTGIMQIGKGPGKLAKISLQWDEAEVTEALRDLNLLSSIIDDVSCL